MLDRLRRTPEHVSGIDRGLAKDREASAKRPKVDDGERRREREREEHRAHGEHELP